MLFKLIYKGSRCIYKDLCWYLYLIKGFLILHSHKIHFYGFTIHLHKNLPSRQPSHFTFFPLMFSFCPFAVCPPDFSPSTLFKNLAENLQRWLSKPFLTKFLSFDHHYQVKKMIIKTFDKVLSYIQRWFYTISFKKSKPHSWAFLLHPPRPLQKAHPPICVIYNI